MSPLEQLARIMCYADKRDPDFIVIGHGLNIPQGHRVPRWRAYSIAAQKILDAGYRRQECS